MTTEKNDLYFVKQCVDYDILKNNLSNEDLIYLEKVLAQFNNYQNKYDDGTIDIIIEYIDKYGDSNIIEWYEGLKSTKSFLEDFSLERGEDYGW